MMRAPILLPFLCLVATTSLPRAANAERAREDASIPTARLRFKEGVEAYDRGDYEAARAAFLQAYSIRKHPAVLLNLGLSSLRSGHGHDAARYLRTFLDESPNATQAQRDEAEKAIGLAREQIARTDAPPVRPIDNNVRPREPLAARARESLVVTQVDPHPRESVSGPATMIPVWVGAAVGAVGISSTIGWAIARDATQHNSDAIAQQIRDNGGSAGICVSNVPSDQGKFGDACAALKKNNDSVDRYAILANIALGAGLAGAATALGWYIWGPRATPTSATLQIAPTIGGIQAYGRF